MNNNNSEYDETLMTHLLHPTKPSNDAITTILNSSGHDDDDSSYMHSIMERRRHIKPERDHEVNGEDESVATSAPLLPPHRKIAAVRRSNRRRGRSSLHSHRKKSVNPIILIVLLGLAANWAATRLLNTFILTIDEDVDVATTQDSDLNRAHHNVVDDNNFSAEKSMYQSEGERMIGKLSLTKLSSGEKLSELTDMRDKYESIIKENDATNDGKKYEDEEMKEKLESLRIKIAMLKEELKANDKDAVKSKSIDKKDDTLQQSSSSITERFIQLRKRFLSLYSEPVPTKPEEHANSTHPLFNTQSPQFQALNWLSNIDKSQLTDDDTHIIQRYALTVLYFSTGGPPVDHNTDFSLKRRGGPWRNPTNFLTPNHECEWKSSVMKGEGRGGGIRRCDKDRNVVELSIYNELTGTIPSELGRLSFLRTLYLGRNNLVGTVPKELGMIQPVASISLQYNQLTGEIPEADLYRIPTLRFLQLEGNLFRGKIKKDGPLCQMRADKTKAVATESGQRRLLRILTATAKCPPSEGDGDEDILYCECCTKCFKKENLDGFR